MDCGSLIWGQKLTWALGAGLLLSPQTRRVRKSDVMEKQTSEITKSHTWVTRFRSAVSPRVASLLHHNLWINIMVERSGRDPQSVSGAEVEDYRVDPKTTRKRCSFGGSQ